MTTAVNEFLGDDAFSTRATIPGQGSARPKSSQARTPDVGRQEASGNTTHPGDRLRSVAGRRTLRIPLRRADESGRRHAWQELPTPPRHAAVFRTTRLLGSLSAR